MMNVINNTEYRFACKIDREPIFTTLRSVSNRYMSGDIEHWSEKYRLFTRL